MLSVALTPHGDWVLSGSKDRGVQFWDPHTGVAQLMLQGHKNSGMSRPFHRCLVLSYANHGSHFRRPKSHGRRLRYGKRRHAGTNLEVSYFPSQLSYTGGRALMECLHTAEVVIAMTSLLLRELFTLCGRGHPILSAR